MRPRVDEDEVFRRLRHAGRVGDLDADRVLELVELRIDGTGDASIGDVPVGVVPGDVVPVGVAPGDVVPVDVGAGDVAWPSARPRAVRGLLAVPLAAAAAVGVLVAVNVAADLSPGPVRAPAPAAGSGPTSGAGSGTATGTAAGPGMGGPGTAAGPGVVDDGGNRQPGAAGGPGRSGGPGGSTTSAGGVALAVAAVPVGTALRMPLRDGREWLLVGSVAESSQVRVPAGASAVGPAQSVGSGQALATGPFALSWAGQGGSSAGPWRRWVTAPGAVRGAPAGLRIPVRVKRFPATITLVTGTVGGEGVVRAEIADPRRGGSVLTGVLPGCATGTCPALVTITLPARRANTSSTEVMVELRAATAGASIGLAAVELD